jgi:hypothetical protein
MRRPLLVAAWLVATLLTTQASLCGDSEPAQCLERRAEIEADWEAIKVSCDTLATRNDEACGYYLKEVYADRDFADALGCRRE